MDRHSVSVRTVVLAEAQRAEKAKPVTERKFRFLFWNSVLTFARMEQATRWPQTGSLFLGNGRTNTKDSVLVSVVCGWNVRQQEKLDKIAKQESVCHTHLHCRGDFLHVLTVPSLVLPVIDAG